jgi:hypothetical protein
MLLNSEKALERSLREFCLASVARAQVESKTGFVFHVEQIFWARESRKNPDFDKIRPPELKLRDSGPFVG